MVTIKLFGSLRLKTGFREMQAYASSVAEACGLLARATGYDKRNSKTACSSSTANGANTPHRSMMAMSSSSCHLPAADDTVRYISVRCALTAKLNL